MLKIAKIAITIYRSCMRIILSIALTIFLLRVGCEIDKSRVDRDELEGIRFWIFVTLAAPIVAVAAGVFLIYSHIPHG